MYSSASHIQNKIKSIILLPKFGYFRLEPKYYCINVYNFTYALCLGKPICKRICNGDKCCFEILVGVGFLRGGKVAIVENVFSRFNLKYFLDF